MNSNQVKAIVSDLNTVQPNGVIGGAVARKNPGAVNLINSIDSQRQVIANAEMAIAGFSENLARLPFVGSEVEGYLPKACTGEVEAKHATK